MTPIEGALLGLIHGSTDFLPLSGLGHIALIQNFLSIDSVQQTALLAVLYSVSAAVVSLYFWQDLWVIAQTLLRTLGRLPVNQKDATFLYAMLIGAVPAVVIGFVFSANTVMNASATGMIATVLLASCVFFMYAEWRYYGNPLHESVRFKSGFLMSLFQIASLLPGFSRHGALMTGGMLLGLSRYESARVACLLALPTVTVIAVRSWLTVITINEPIYWASALIAGCVSGIVSLLCLHLFLTYCKKYTLWPFIWYGIVLAALVGYVSVIL